MNVDEDLSTPEESSVPDDILKEAISYGWTPKDKFKGPADQWIDADEFVEKGRHVLPIVIANNKRLQKELLTRDQKIGTMSKSLEVLQKVHKENTDRAVSAAITQVKEEIKLARENYDVDKELELVDKLADLKKEQQAPATGPKEEVPPAEELSPDFQEWISENQWFGGQSPEDQKKTRAMVRIGRELREEGEEALGKPFMELCVLEYERRNPGASERQVSKVEGGRLGPTGGGGSGSSAGKGYAALPKAAKDACDSYADDLVGPGKAYKDLKTWQATYAKTYFEE